MAITIDIDGSKSSSISERQEKNKKAFMSPNPFEENPCKKRDCRLPPPDPFKKKKIKPTRFIYIAKK